MIRHPIPANPSLEEPGADHRPIKRAGGRVPMLADVPAFELISPEPSPIPVLIAVPHAGRAYSPILLDRMRHPALAALRLEDRLADALGRAVAEATGAALLVAAAPRALIDLNRDVEDIDWDMVVTTGRGEASRSGPRALPSRRARSGLGLIPRRLPGTGELWKRRIDPAELQQRIADVHDPYHAALGQELVRLRQRWGAALLIDLHSMPPLGGRATDAGPAFVVGDRFGASCSGALIASTFERLGRAGETAAHNRPYAGGYVLERHADPARGIHAFQLEIDRSRYLDSRLAELGSGFPAMVELLRALVASLAGEVAALAHSQSPGRWAEAAE